MCHPLPLFFNPDDTPKGGGIQRRRRVRLAAGSGDQIGLRHIGFATQSDPISRAKSDVGFLCLTVTILWEALGPVRKRFIPHSPDEAGVLSAFGMIMV